VTENNRTYKLLRLSHCDLIFLYKNHKISPTFSMQIQLLVHMIGPIKTFIRVIKG